MTILHPLHVGDLQANMAAAEGAGSRVSADLFLGAIEAVGRGDHAKAAELDRRGMRLYREHVRPAEPKAWLRDRLSDADVDEIVKRTVTESDGSQRPI